MMSSLTENFMWMEKLCDLLTFQRVSGLGWKSGPTRKLQINAADIGLRAYQRRQTPFFV